MRSEHVHISVICLKLRLLFNNVWKVLLLKRIYNSTSQIKFPLNQERSILLGSYRGGVTPVPIPNTEVKPSFADDTAHKSVGE